MKYCPEILMDPILCFTDGSKSKNRVGFAFSVGDTTVALRDQNPTSSYTAELQAIFSCLEHILTTTYSPSSSPFLIIIDSLCLSCVSLCELKWKGREN